MILKEPQSVAIVAMGRSFKTYVQLVCNLGRRGRAADEVWAINAMGGVIQHDRLFVMDDMREVLAPLARKEPTSMPAGLLEMLGNHPGPVYTSKVYEEYPCTVEYPLEDVINAVGNVYFNTSVAYAVALAIHLKVKEIGLYGCDFTYPDLHVAESGRSCVEFLIGVAGTYGAKIVVAGDSTLMDSSMTVNQKLYGYKDPMEIGQSEDGKRITVRSVTAEPEQPQPQEQTDELRRTTHSVSDNGHDRDRDRAHAGSHR